MAEPYGVQIAKMRVEIAKLKIRIKELQIDQLRAYIDRQPAIVVQPTLWEEADPDCRVITAINKATEPF